MPEHVRRVAHPEWIGDAFAKFARSAELYRQGYLPSSIEVTMLVVPIKRVLRGVYGGSNLRVALILLRMALSETMRELRWTVTDFLLFVVLRKDREAHYESMVNRLEREASDDRANN